MNIKKLYLKNFYSYAEEKIEFSNEGIYIIYGEDAQSKSRNGIGKSAILEAIQFALFGKLRVDSIDDAVRFGTSEMEVELTFNLNNNSYSVIRGREKTKKTYVDVYLNGKKVANPTISDNNEYIIGVLGLDYEQFIHSFFYGQGEYDNLQVFTSKKLIDFLKTILQLNRFDDYKAITKEKLKDREDNINKLLGVKETLGQLQTINKSKKELTGQLEKLRGVLDKADEKLRVINKEVDTSITRLNSGNENLKVVDSKLQTINKRIDYIEENKKCPTCKQTLKDGVVEKELHIQWDKLNNDKIDIEKNIKEYTDEVNAYREEKDLIMQKANKENREILEVSYQLNMLNKAATLDKDEIEKKYKKLLAEKEILEGVTNIFDSKGLPLYILNSYIPKLEGVINEVLNRLTNFKISIITQEKLKSTDKLANVCKIKIIRGANVYSIGNLSKGEERLVNIAFRIGIAKIFLERCKFETLMLDEVFSSLGATNRDKVVALVQYLKNTFKKILVISHIDDVRDCFTQENQLEVIKSKGVSRISIYNINREIK
jgi:DNA repair exonuclease SbcCD ATPase subunit